MLPTKLTTAARCGSFPADTARAGGDAIDVTLMFVSLAFSIPHVVVLEDAFVDVGAIGAVCRPPVGRIMYELVYSSKRRIYYYCKEHVAVSTATSARQRRAAATAGRSQT
jgi:hypothetical protein